jgi:hypothetical protein
MAQNGYFAKFYPVFKNNLLFFPCFAFDTNWDEKSIGGRECNQNVVYKGSSRRPSQIIWMSRFIGHYILPSAKF